MKISIETKNSFYDGWVAHFLGLPRDCVDDGTIWRNGWDMGHETADLGKSAEYYKNVIHQANLGRLYMAVLAEMETGNIEIKVRQFSEDHCDAQETEITQ